jgi:predicted RNA-binding protein (virulence factor B family)
LGVTVVLTGFGIPVIECTNPGASANPAPGQNPSQVSASGSQIIGGQDITKNGKATVKVAVEDLIGATIEPATQGGCANNNWTATIIAIQWTGAFVDVFNNDGGGLLLHVEFTCALRTGSTTIYDCTRIS